MLEVLYLNLNFITRLEILYLSTNPFSDIFVTSILLVNLLKSEVVKYFASMSDFKEM